MFEDRESHIGLRGNVRAMSFVQFSFCPLCRISHKQKRKHVYSNRHQTIVTNMLNKFLKKIQDARDTLDRPVIEGLEFEQGSKFWCYFCTEEISKHLVLDVCVLKFGGLLEHIACLEHKKKMYAFFYDNRVDETQRHPDLFFLQTEELNRFKELAEKHIQQYEAVKRKELLLYKNQLSVKGHRQQQAAQMDDGKSEMIRQGCSRHSVLSQSNIAVAEKKATYLAHGEGLTFIGTHDYIEGEGNIHTGATPPWLQGEKESGYGGEIGPTAEAFKKHLQQERKRKLLPATRVGAGFDRKSQADEQWLPSFGRVWNKGRRLQSKQYFEKQFMGTSKKRRISESLHPRLPHESVEKDSHDRRHIVTEASARSDMSCMPISPKYVKPYVKKTSVSLTNSVPPQSEDPSSVILPKHIPTLLPTPVLKSKTKKTCTVTTIKGEILPYSDNRIQDSGINKPESLTRLDSKMSQYDSSVGPVSMEYNPISTGVYEEKFSSMNSQELHIKPYSRKRKHQQ